MQTSNSNTAKQAGNINYCFTPDGAFVAADLASGLTSYAYRSSSFATDAKRNPVRVATLMIEGEQWRAFLAPAFHEYDKINLAFIAEAQKRAEFDAKVRATDALHDSN